MGDTIFACATASGRAGVAIVRISGPSAGAALAALGVKAGPARTMQRAIFRDPESGEALDDGMVVRFPAPRSYTGEDVVELHLHAGRAVLDAVVSALARIPGLRLAEPGEFTRRAFENGKLDLTEAEAIADLVAAETAAQRRQALRQLGGELGRLYEGWRERLVRVLAHTEADIDFPDEGLPGDLRDAARREIRPLRSEIERHLADNRRGERVREGLSIAILGPPNAGKSTLLNRLARREAAITSAIAGTTRDVIEVHLDLGGFAVTVADTAGLRATRDEIEAEGVRRAEARAASADLKLVILDATRPGQAEGPVRALVDRDTIVIANKIDLAPSADAAAWADALGGGPAARLSATSGAGLDALLERLTREIAQRFDQSAAPTLTRARHRAALDDCVAALQRFEAASLPELAAEDLRLAARALGRITGRVDVEDLLDVIFREFCIGK
ncbi:MAG TPA: tRNA uridine-5-carboxymethylaminomethyl(34) synthesis GTPase MnmE [Stellaceae bacterium]|nr:tRNA uridine-5-carboxymethylaminomethyl(34) synthesis GTPase MnmE [Stellaceae bacterium]